MIRKDFIEAEIQKLAQVIAKIIGLKNEGKLDEAIEISDQSLSENFGFDQKLIEQGSVEEFETELKSRNYSAEKLNALAQILFESSYPFQDTEECVAVMHKVALVLHLLETEYHQQSFENLSRREMIDNFLNNEQYE
ncbi:hypothetical protein WG906_15870 [Pedobacter sp. P351]|uniref:hypothetical protein n=1 Tax=Pedobacter superstes TaxID=3133441 RepID=UPI0030A07134